MPDDGWEGVKERSKVVGCLRRECLMERLVRQDSNLHIMHFLHIIGSKQFNMPLDKQRQADD